MLHVNQCHFQFVPVPIIVFCACQDCNQCNVQRSCRYCLAAYHITPPLSTFVPEFLYMQKTEVLINPWNYYLCPLLVYPASTFVLIHRETENFVLVPTLLLLKGNRCHVTKNSLTFFLPICTLRHLKILSTVYTGRASGSMSSSCRSTGLLHEDSRQGFRREM